MTDVTQSASTAQVSAQEPQTLTNPKDKLSYAFGQQFGQNIGKYLQQQNIKLNSDVVAQGIKDALSGKSSLLSQQEIRQTNWITCTYYT